MAENLNFGTRIAASADQKDATVSGAEKYCYDDNELNCDAFGGLYQWHSAMALPYSCNSTSSGTGSCIVKTPHQGICPEGWHLPTKEEWTTLDSWVDSDNGGESNDAGHSLKSTTGWNLNRNGTDAYSWNGLPGGYRYDGGILYQGRFGYWWSASEYLASFAWFRYLEDDSHHFTEHNNSKHIFGFSIRCVKDAG